MGIPISNVTRRVVYAASGTGPYNFTFEILAAGDVAVYKDDALLTITTDYTVTINSNGTGYITLTASPTGATQIAIVGNRTIQRTSDFVTGGDFFANTVNTELDSLTIFAQQNAESVDRALKAPQTDPTTIDMTLPRASVRANKTLAFDTNGNPTTGEVIGDNRGDWLTGTAYNKRDIVRDASNGNVYYANEAHTSTGTTPISSNADAAKWDLIVNNAASAAAQSAAAASASAAATSASNASTSATNAASSASTASTQASNASTSATNAANSATAAASSASTASTQASNAATSATNAANSATSASNSASTATTQATNASNSATSAATSASQASTSASNAASSASTATTQASNAATSATNAANSATASASSATNSANSATASANSATAAAGSATSAAASAAAAAASLDNFDDRYLGAKASNPTVDNDGDPLVTGALYYRTTAPIGMKVWDGSQWLEASAAQQASLVTYEYVATAGQTTFSGTDANGVTLSYTVGNVVVSINGVVQNPGDDYTATNGTSIVLASAAALNDEIMVLAFRTFDVANTYTQAQVDAAIAGRQPLDSELTTLAGMTASRATFLAGAEGFGFRNRIINGDMRVAQRGTSFSTLGAYTLDRWMFGNGSSGSITQSTDAPAGFRNSISLSATGFPTLIQRIEALNCDGLVSQTATVSFWAKQTSGAGANSVGVQLNYPNSGADNYGGGVTSISTQTATGSTNWTYYTFNFTLPSNVANGLQINLFGNTAGAATILFTGVQLEAGTVATPFERRDYGRELMMCQRYYTRFLAEASYSSFGIGTAYNTVTIRLALPPPVRMRAKPTSLDASAGNTFLVEYGSAGLAASAVGLSGNDSSTMLNVSFTVSGATAGASYAVYANGTAGAYLGFGAEL